MMTSKIIRRVLCEACDTIEVYEAKLGTIVACAACEAPLTVAKRNSDRLWGWRVVRDYGYNPQYDTPEWNRQGKTYREYQGGKHRYRLRDDDGNACYLIESDIAPTSTSESQLFAPLEWAMADVGATSIEYRTAEGWEYL